MENGLPRSLGICWLEFSLFIYIVPLLVEGMGVEPQALSAVYRLGTALSWWSASDVSLVAFTKVSYTVQVSTGGILPKVFPRLRVGGVPRDLALRINYWFRARALRCRSL